MFGSDWPVCTPAASYGEVLDIARRLTDPGTHTEIFEATAVRVYGL